MRQTFVLYSCLLLFQTSISQTTIGIPNIINYSRQSYHGGAQNWGICQDVKGLVYFANNEGLLSFDGIYWKIYPLPNKTIVRSVIIGADNNLYTGGQDEIGYFSPDAQGYLSYHSLKNLIPANARSFNDVWGVASVGNQIFFRSNKYIFKYSDNHITVYPSVYPSNTWLFLGATKDFLIAQDAQKGVLKFDKDIWVPLEGTDALPGDFVITSVLPAGKDSVFITSQKHGIYLYTQGRLSPFSAPALQKISGDDINNAIAIDDDHFALATTKMGCLIIDKAGNLLQQYSRQQGLQYDKVLSIFSDGQKNLWLGLDYGIDFIAYNSAVKHVYPNKKNENAGYSAIIYKNNLYLATADGVYYAPLSKKEDLSKVEGEFKMIRNINGQVWSLSEINGKLLAGHYEGLYEIQDDKAILIDKSVGFWTTLPYNEVQPSSMMVAGTYDGLRFYPYQNGQFSKKHIAADFGSARTIVISNNNIWVSHPYEGIYRIQLQASGSPRIEEYGKNHGLGSNIFGNRLFKIRNRIVVTNDSGIYEFNEHTERFELSADLMSVFGQIKVQYMKEDPYGNIWFVFDKNLGVVDYSGKKPVLMYINELNQKLVSIFEQVYPVDKQNIFIGAEKGYFHLNFSKYKAYHPKLQVQFSKVIISGTRDSLLFNGYFNNVNEVQQQKNIPEIPHQWNSIHFEFSSPFYEQQSNIEYSYFLKGHDKKWSGWNNKAERDFLSLPPGKYQFNIRARNNPGNISEVYTYSFTILPPWYLTWWSNLLYISIVLYTLYIVYRKQKQKLARQKKQFEEKQRQLQNLYQLELEKNEKEIVKLRNDKLEAEIQHKNREVASATMHLVKKGELITKVKDELSLLSKISESGKAAEVLKKLIKTLGEDERMDEDWEHFTIHFDKVHNDFFTALKSKHPDLTPNEIKLCAYLRMNLSTKEMARLLNISVRGVEISRYRLRKKLKISSETNLFNYLLNFSRTSETNS
ncbi:MAG: hypothetical protein IT214_05740 [Chitinophagaceae bacterium]|nr:hypothetical protein [Chitinophagaceae bacterium]